jgi:hypothetical protein
VKRAGPVYSGRVEKMNTKSGLEADVQKMSELARTGLNERTRVKIAIKEIMMELGHDPDAIDGALADVCNCDFRPLRRLFELEPGKSHAKSGYTNSNGETTLRVFDDVGGTRT